jgi:[ribosomal protein S18]-alanine N-acetyltransferase
MREKLVMRGYEENDLDGLVRLDEACFAPPFRFSKAAMRRFVEAENAWVIVAEAGGEVKGFCIVHRERAEASDAGYVVTIDVAAGFRGRGTGERMLARGEAWVRSWKGAGMMLHVFVENERAVRFYERMQYRRVGVQPGFYGPGLHAAMYWKELSPA